jgi:hypothetical protein
MTRHQPQKLTLRDFTFYGESEYGPAYTCGPYTIDVGRRSYAVTYKGQTIDFGLRDILSAVEVAACHASVKRIKK